MQKLGFGNAQLHNFINQLFFLMHFKQRSATCSKT